MSTLKSQLTFLMSVSEACEILGDDCVTRIVSGVVMLQTTTNESLYKSYTKKQLQDLEKVCNEKTDCLTQAMKFVPGKASADSNGGAQQAMMLMKAMDISSVAASGSTDHREDKIPAPIRSSWKALISSRSLMLDKIALLKFLVPTCAQPHTGPNGHMGLFDCLMYALQSKAAAMTVTESPSMAPNSMSLVTIPDICIFFAICKKYWDLQNQMDPDAIASFSGDDPIIKNMSHLMFMVYDGYQKTSVIGRDTIHRFMSDVYGDDSYKTSPEKDVLNKIFSNPNSPLTNREFKDAIVQTMVYSPKPSHFLLDWLATLVHAIMPARFSQLANGSSDKHVNGDVVTVTAGRNLPQSAAVFLQTMDQQRRWLPQICEKYHLAEYRLYEIKRRFHSLVESTSTIIKGNPMHESGCGVGDRGNSKTTGGKKSSLETSKNSRNAPKHVISGTVFCKKVSQPSEELGHGGYLPHALAVRVFNSVAKSSSLYGDIGDRKDEDNGSDNDIDESTCYWDLCHVLQFGGMCLRSAEDNDKALVTWVMMMFCKPEQKVLNRSQAENLMTCLCAHADFRNSVDRPKWDQEDYDESEANDEKDGDTASSEAMVTTSSAIELDLLPISYGRGSLNRPEKVQVKALVDYMFKTINSTDGTVTEKQFLKWHYGTKIREKQKLGPLLIDLRLIAGVMFGVPPKLGSLEYILIMNIQERHRKRFPQTDVSRRGPRGTVWYLVDHMWYKSWTEMMKIVSNTKEDGEDLRDKTSNSSSPRRLGQINNTKLLRENGSLALRVDIKWRHDYEILPPLGWSALQAWYDGGPPVSRMVVPYHSGSSGTRGRSMNLRTDNEIELYPFFVTMFLCDSSSRGEAHPFQQAVPVSRVSPVRVLLVQLCKELDADPNKTRLWVIEPSTDPEENGNDDNWLLEVDFNIVEQRKNRIGADQSGKSNINILLELKNEETNEWPRGIDGKNWTYKNGDSSKMEIGDGIVGLFNMGNTCYLNSSIQCLSHTPIFRDYFISKCYLNDINTSNPLGHEGHLAQVSAVLINSIWKRFNQQVLHQPKRVTAPGSYALVNAPALTPKTFKESLGKFNEHFAGNEQHDAQELLAFLLGGLSEDLNRIQNKPYIEAPDSDGRPDCELADIWWANHLKREMSIIVAMFTGQYKSLLKCKSCSYESARFEPFSFLQLPLPADDTVPVSLVFYPSEPGMSITKYSVRVHTNGTLYDVLIALAKVIHSDEQQENDSNSLGAPRNVEQEEVMKLNGIYSNLARNMAVVDMKDGFIFKIAPNAWRLPDLQNKDTGELPMLHVYGFDPLSDKTKGDGQVNEEDETDDVTTPNCAFLALAQRRSELLSKELIHPLNHRVFGTPLLLRVVDLDGKTGSEVYDIVAKHLHPVVPPGALKFLTNTVPPLAVDSKKNDESKTKKEIRRSLEKSTSDTEEVSAGSIPRYGFRLRLASREGRRCAVCPWYECCIGCLIPDDANPTVVANGDSLAIDWHFAVDVATAGFGTRVTEPTLSSKDSPLRRCVPGVEIKNHVSCGIGPKKSQDNIISLEDCLDAFAEEEKIPEAYCSKCKDFKVQTKMMSLWRLPPVVIIQLKRFQFTQHMRRKLRDFVNFPVEGLDLSRIMAKGVSSGATNENDSENNVASKEKENTSSRMNDDDGRSENLYDLYGVVHHQGALSGGHYVASLKSDIDGQWRLFNDAQIYEIHSRDVVDATAYILFYIRRDVANQELSDFWDVRKRVGEGLTENEMNELIKGRSEKCVIS